MSGFALFAVSLAALAAVAVAIRIFVLLGRVQQLVETVKRTVESDVTDTVRELGETARGVQKAVGKLDDGLGSLASSLDRVDRLTEKLEPDSVTRTVVQPAVAKIAAWIGGVRKGMSAARERKAKGAAEE